MLPILRAEGDVYLCLQFMASAEAQKRYWARSFAGWPASQPAHKPRVACDPHQKCICCHPTMSVQHVWQQAAQEA